MVLRDAMCCPLPPSEARGVSGGMGGNYRRVPHAIMNAIALELRRVTRASTCLKDNAYPWLNTFTLSPIRVVTVKYIPLRESKRNIVKE
jgi:hypothetical protein